MNCLKTETDFDLLYVNNFQPLLCTPTSIDWGEIGNSGKKVIYMISDPRSSVINAYIGQTNNQDRFSQHISDAKRKGINWPSQSKLSWLRELMNIGLAPKIEIIQIVDSGDADYIELLWIGLLEHSPFHILVNGLDTRAVGATLVPLDITVPTFNQKGLCYAKISALQEYWLGHWNPLVGYSTEGNCLVRCEEAAIADVSLVQRIQFMTLRQYYAEVLGEENLNNIIVGMKKAYRRADIKLSAPNTIEVRFSSYVPWRYQKTGIPVSLRQE